jgi:hypothetical protein
MTGEAVHEDGEQGMREKVEKKKKYTKKSK